LIKCTKILGSGEPLAPGHVLPIFQSTPSIVNGTRPLPFSTGIVARRLVDQISINGTRSLRTKMFSSC